MARKKKAAKRVAKKKAYHREAPPPEPETQPEPESPPIPVLPPPPPSELLPAEPEPQAEIEPKTEAAPEPKGIGGMFFGPEDLTKPAWPAGAPNREDVAVAYKNDWGDWVFKMKGTNRKIIIKES